MPMKLKKTRHKFRSKLEQRMKNWFTLKDLMNRWMDTFGSTIPLDKVSVSLLIQGFITTGMQILLHVMYLWPFYDYLKIN